MRFVRICQIFRQISTKKGEIAAIFSFSSVEILSLSAYLSNPWYFIKSKLLLYFRNSALGTYFSRLPSDSTSMPCILSLYSLFVRPKMLFFSKLTPRQCAKSKSEKRRKNKRVRKKESEMQNIDSRGVIKFLKKHG